MKYINIPYFILAFAFGIFFVYITNPNKETIYVYPTPDNINKIQYKDRAEQCFEYEPQLTTCSKQAESYPFQ